MDIKEKAEKCAKHEIGWWQAHHRKNKELLIKELASVDSILHEIDYQTAETAVAYKMQATKEHDLAEKFEDVGDIEEAQKHWKKAKELLEKYFETLLKAKQ